MVTNTAALLLSCLHRVTSYIRRHLASSCLLLCQHSQSHTMRILHVHMGHLILTGTGESCPPPQGTHTAASPGVF